MTAADAFGSPERERTLKVRQEAPRNNAAGPAAPGPLKEKHQAGGFQIGREGRGGAPANQQNNNFKEL